MNSNEFQAQTEQINRLVQRVSELEDEDARTLAIELLQSLMNLHGAAMSRVTEILSEQGQAGHTALAKLSADPLICGLLVLYGVHPLGTEQRVIQAIEKVRPQLNKQGGAVELLGIADSVVRLKMEISSHGCGSSPEKIRNLVEQAILEAAPELMEIIVEGLPASAPVFVPVSMIQPAKKEEERYEESAA